MAKIHELASVLADQIAVRVKWLNGPHPVKNRNVVDAQATD